MKTIPCLILATLLLSGCSSPKINTPSGQTEVTIHASLPKVKAAMLNGMVERGYEIRSSDDAVIMGERDAGTAAWVLFGTTYNPSAKIRVRANLIPIGDLVRVLYRGQLVGGNGVESPLPPNAQTQYWLECLAADLEERPRPPAPPKPEVVSATAPKSR